MPNYLRIIILLASILVGLSAFKIQPRIQNGYNSDRHQFPFYVFLRLFSRGQAAGACGAVLLSDSWIITAAHCLEGGKPEPVDRVQAHFGTWSHDKYFESGRQIRSIPRRQFFIHPEYSEIDGWQNDIALIRITKTLTLNATIQSVYILNDCSIRENSDLTAIGNGYTDGKEMPNVLQFTTLTVTSSRECKKIYPFIDENKVFCAIGYDDESIGLGDSGGPIVHPLQYSLYGLMSFAAKNCPANVPQGFTNIFAHKDFINGVTGTEFIRC